MTYSWAGENYY